MKFSLQALIASLKVLILPWFFVVLGSGVGVSVLRNLQNWTVTPAIIVPILLFTGGIVLGFWLIATHQIWLQFILSSLPGAQQEDQEALNVLRSPLLFVILPILTFILLGSDSATVGLGFLWGVLGWYVPEAWALLHGDPAKMQLYFPHLQRVQTDLVYTVVLWGFLLTYVLYAAGLILYW